MRDFSVLKQRILEYLQLKGITRYEFYRSTGISNGILSQNNGLSEENMMKFLSRYEDVNYVWFLTGEGSILKENSLKEEYGYVSRRMDKIKQEEERLLHEEKALLKYDNSNELKMIRELASENALLKKENEELKKKRRGSRRKEEFIYKSDIAAKS